MHDTTTRPGLPETAPHDPQNGTAGTTGSTRAKATPPGKRKRRRTRALAPADVLAIVTTSLVEAEYILRDDATEPSEKLRAVHAISQAAATYAKLYDVWYAEPLLQRFDAAIEAMQTNAARRFTPSPTGVQPDYLTPDYLAPDALTRAHLMDAAERVNEAYAESTPDPAPPPPPRPEPRYDRFNLDLKVAGD